MYDNKARAFHTDQTRRVQTVGMGSLYQRAAARELDNVAFERTRGSRERERRRLEIARECNRAVNMYREGTAV